MAGLVLVASCRDEAMSVDEYLAARLEVSCEYLLRCGVTPSLDSCRETREAGGYHPFVIAAVAAGTIRWHGDAAEDCLGRLEQASCDRTSEAYRHIDCQPFFTGTLVDGETCALSTECISGECWTEDRPDVCGVGYCVGNTPPKVGKIGEVCRLSSCEAGARCEASVCVALRSEGESCTYDDAGQCGYGLACSQRRICEPLAGSGERCSTSEDCRMIGETCGFNATCEPVRQVGDTCLQDSQCALHYQCGVSGLCEPGPRIGERCFGYYDCYDAGAFCDAGDTQVCARPKPDGASCGIYTDCASAICVDSTCVATCESN